MEKPRSVAVDEQGSIYVLSGKGTWRFELLKYSNRGRFIGILNKDLLKYWATDLKKYNAQKRELLEKTVYAQTLVFGADGNIYALGDDIGGEPGMVSVIKLNDGKSLRSFSLIKGGKANRLMLRDIAVDGKSNIYVTNYNEAPVQKYSSKGDFIMSIGEKGRGRGKLMSPAGIAVNKKTGDIYVSDLYVTRPMEIDLPQVGVKIFDKNGKYKGKLGNEFIRIKSFFPPIITFFWQNTLGYPESLAVSDDGYVYVLSKFFGPRVTKFAPNGWYVKEWGRAGSGPGEFNAPEAICTDKHGNIYVADTGNDRVQKFDANGAFLMEIR